MREILCSGQARSLEFPYPGGMAALCWSPAGERGELTVSLHYDGAYGMGETVSYTHLTLPTTSRV